MYSHKFGLNMLVKIKWMWSNDKTSFGLKVHRTFCELLKSLSWFPVLDIFGRLSMIRIWSIKTLLLKLSLWHNPHLNTEINANEF